MNAHRHTLFSHKGTKTQRNGFVTQWNWKWSMSKQPIEYLRHIVQLRHRTPFNLNGDEKQRLVFGGGVCHNDVMFLLTTRLQEAA